jgi:hypothetical protein
LREFTAKEYPLSKFMEDVCLQYMGVKSSLGIYKLAGKGAEIYGSGSIEIAMFAKTSAVGSLKNFGVLSTLPTDTSTDMSEVSVVHAKVIPEMKKIASYVIVCFFSPGGVDMLGCNCECPAYLKHIAFSFPCVDLNFFMKRNILNCVSRKLFLIYQTKKKQLICAFFVRLKLKDRKLW